MTDAWPVGAGSGRVAGVRRIGRHRAFVGATAAVAAVLLAAGAASMVAPVEWCGGTNPHGVLSLHYGSASIHFASFQDPDGEWANPAEAFDGRGWPMVPPHGCGPNISAVDAGWADRLAFAAAGPAWRSYGYGVRDIGRQQTISATLPLLVLALLAGLPTAVVGVRHLLDKERRHRAAGRCGGCGYDLRATTVGRCSECGRPTDAPMAADGLGWVATAACVVLVLTAAWFGVAAAGSAVVGRRVALVEVRRSHMDYLSSFAIPARVAEVGIDRLSLYAGAAPVGFQSPDVAAVFPRPSMLGLAAAGYESKSTNLGPAWRLNVPLLAGVAVLLMPPVAVALRARSRRHRPTS